jgi:hypothetical protein
MEARYEKPRFDALGAACVIWAATVVVLVVATLVYLAVKDDSYSYPQFCGNLSARAYSAKFSEPSIWDDYELLCE